MLAKIAQYAKKPMPYILLFNIVLWIPSLFTSPGPGIDISRSDIGSHTIQSCRRHSHTPPTAVIRKALKFARVEVKADNS